MRLINADSIRGLAKHIKTNKNFEPYIMIDDLAKVIYEQPTAYSVDKVVEELEQKKEEVQRIRNTCVALSDLEVCDIENVTYERAIEIVKQSGVSDDVCEWIKYDYRTICPKDHDANNPYWRIPENTDKLKYCPYCGKKIKVVE